MIPPAAADCLGRSQTAAAVHHSVLRAAISILNDPKTREDGDDAHSGHRSVCYQPRIFANMSGAQIVASDSMMNFGVSSASLPHVIFSFGTAPEYDP